jgi:hypothetical protein
MRYFVACVRREKRIAGTERGGIAELGLATSPVGDVVVHKGAKEVISDIESGEHEYFAVANDEPLNEARWTALEVIWRHEEEILRTEPTYDPPTYLSNKPKCNHA